MSRLNRLCILLAFVIAASSTALGQVKDAFMRVETAGGNEVFYVEINLEAPINPKAASLPQGALYDENGKQVTTAVTVQDDAHLRIYLPAGTNPTQGFDVVIHQYETNKYVMTGGKAAVDRDYAIKLITNNPACSDGRGQYYSIFVQGKKRNAYTLQRLYKIYDWLSTRVGNAKGLGTLDIEVESRKGTQTGFSAKSVELLPKYKSVAQVPKPGVASVEGNGGVVLCIVPEHTPPSEQFDARFTFSGASVPLELRKPILATELAGFSNIDVASSSELFSESADPGTRSLEKNLDLGVSLTSSVENKEEGTTIVRKRTTRGTLDLRFAPWLNSRFGYKRPQAGVWRSFYTPIFLDAKVSTGKIVEDTLSLNRVVIGTEKEYRYVQNTKRFPTFYRVNVRGSHASDRDFKQGEYKAGIEFIPNFGPLVHPLTSFIEIEKHQLDEDPDRGVKLIPGRFGYEIRPVLGAEIGRTYFRRRPATAIEPSDTVRRFYFGGEVLLQLTERLNLKFSDTMYVRGESKADRLHNYFIAEAELPIGHRWNNSGYSLFVAFERGGQPPFANPDVNVWKIGYRIQSRNWFNSFR